MKIAVIGPGGVGGFLAALLCRAGHNVTVLGRGAHLAAICDRGITIESMTLGTFTVQPKATDNPADLGSNDLVLVAVKMYDFASICPIAAAALSSDGVVVPIQNGLDATELMSTAAGPDRTLTASATIESTVIAPGTIAHTLPILWLTLAEGSGPPTERLRSLAVILQDAEIPVRLADDGRQLLWNKAAMLIPSATVTTAADCTMAEIWATPALKAVADALLEEAAAVAAADGYDVRPSLASYQEAFEKVLSIAPGFTSSMCRDFRAGRRSELEWLTGRLIRIAHDRNVPVPTYDALYGLLVLRAQRQAEARERREEPVPA